MKFSAKDLKRIAEAKLDLNSFDAEKIAMHLGLDKKLVEEVFEDPIFLDLLDLHEKQKFAMWAGIIADEEKELGRIIARLGYDAILRLKALIYSENEKVANLAIRTALEYNSELERPVVRHEITTRFTQEEIDKARDVVKRLRPKPLPALPAPPDGLAN
jgi:hypothetical protein